MSNNKSVFVIGILILVMPYLGFPYQWKNIFYMVAGAILIALTLYARLRKGDRHHIKIEVFSENSSKT